MKWRDLGLIIAPSACCVWGGVGASAVLPGMRSRYVLLPFPNPRLPFHLRLNIIATTCQSPPSYSHTAAWIICPRAWSHLPASWTEWHSTMPAMRWRGGARAAGAGAARAGHLGAKGEGCHMFGWAGGLSSGRRAEGVQGTGSQTVA